jgi:hypothetical protein
MARSDSFFIRATAILPTTGVFTPITIDLGSFVDALGKTVLRIHNTSIQYKYASGGTDTGQPSLLAVGTSGITQWQLTTQNQTAILPASDRSLIASGNLNAVNNSATPFFYTFATQDLDVAPQVWTNGYLVAVESLQFGGTSSIAFAHSCHVSIVLECTVETMTSAAAMALALSQQ